MAVSRPAKRVEDRHGSSESLAPALELRLALGAAELAASCGCAQPTIAIADSTPSDDSTSAVREALAARGIGTSTSSNTSDADLHWPRHVCAIVDATGAPAGSADRLAARHRLPVVHADPALADHPRPRTTTTSVDDILRYRLVDEEVGAVLDAEGESQPDRVALSCLTVAPVAFQEGKLRLQLGTQTQDLPSGSGVKVRPVDGQLEVRLVPPYGDIVIWRRNDVAIVQESGRHTLLCDDLAAQDLAGGLAVEFGARALHRVWV